jgi:hypothetical protein
MSISKLGAVARTAYYAELAKSDGQWDAVADAIQAELASVPIDMVLYCPACGMQHVDAPSPCRTDIECTLAGECYYEKAGMPKGCTKWNNPPHRSHLCAGCGHVWRPADVATNGVATTKTQGWNDSKKVANAAYAGLAVVDPGESWFQRVAVLAGVWPRGHENSVPDAIVEAVRRYYSAMRRARY